MNKIKAINQVVQRVMNNEGPRPTLNRAHWKAETCPICHRRIATKKAFDELARGQGTNLCWGDCEREAPDMIAVPKLMPLVKHYLELVNQLTDEQAANDWREERLDQRPPL